LTLRVRSIPFRSDGSIRQKTSRGGFHREPVRRGSFQISVQFTRRCWANACAALLYDRMLARRPDGVPRGDISIEVYPVHVGMRKSIGLRPEVGGRPKHRSTEASPVLGDLAGQEIARGVRELATCGKAFDAGDIPVHEAPWPRDRIRRSATLRDPLTGIASLMRGAIRHPGRASRSGTTPGLRSGGRRVRAFAALNSNRPTVEKS
jgi:hypothetical protein